MFDVRCSMCDLGAAPDGPVDPVTGLLLHRKSSIEHRK